MKRFFPKKSSTSSTGTGTSGQSPPQQQPQQPQVVPLHPQLSPAEQQQLETEYVNAVNDGNLNKVKDCIRKGVNVEAEDKDSWRAIHYASFYGHLHIVQYLTEQCQVDVNAKINDGHSALHFASLQGHLDVVKYFIQDCRVDVNTTKANDGATALHWASYNGHLDVVKYFIQDCQVDVNTTKNNDGATALHYASNNGHLDVVKYFIQDCRVDVNTTKNKVGSTALHLASYGGHLKMAQYLIEDCHLDVDAKNFWDDTAYDVAIRKKHFDVATLLADQTIAQKKTSMKSATNAISSLVEEFVTAVGNGDIGTSLACINSGVDVEAQNSSSWKALHYACLQGHLHMVKFLIEKCGAKVAAKNNGRTALHVTSKYGHLEIAQYLIKDCGVDIEARDNFGITALHFSSRYGYFDIVQYLVEKWDADTAATTMWGATAREIARDYEESTIEDYLKKQPEKIQPVIQAELRQPSTPISMINTSSNTPEIVSDRKKMEGLMNDPTADPIVLSLKYLELCTDNFTSKVLGSGAFGKVFFGCDKELGVQLAVKCSEWHITDQATLDEIALSFKREIAVLKRFRHPNIVVLYGYNILEKLNSQILVYEYLSNGSLAEFLKDERGRTRLPSTTRISVMFQLARSVHFLHTGGCDNFTVFHRDIKSGNICLTHDYTAKLIDCGLAKFVTENSSNVLQGSVTPTMLKSSGAAVFGTAGYICPVYARGQSQYTAACDVFSIGVVFAELLTGSLQGGQSSLSGKSLGDYFGRYIKDEDDDPIEDGWKIMKEDVDVLAQWNDDIMESLCKMAVKCMASSPKRRISTLELVQNLSEISSKDFTISCDIGSDSVTPDSINVQQLTINGVTDACNKLDGNGTSELYYHCVLCNRSTCGNVSCVDGHRTCVQCIEQAIQIHMGKTGDSLRCKCGALIHDSALFGKISLSTYNSYIRERSLQKAIEEKFDGMKLHLHRISSMSEQNHEQVMVSLKGISSNIQRVLGGLAYVATNSVQQCPTVVWLVPAEPTAGNSAKAWKQWARNLTTKKYDLFFVCQHSFEVVEAKMTITVPRSWVTQAAPALYLSMFLLKTALTIGGLPALPFPIPSVLSRADQITMNEEFVTDLLDSATLCLVEAFKAAYTQGLDLPYPETSQLLALTGTSYEGIVAKATSMKRCHWKQSMEPVTNHRGSVIWVKKEYRDFY